MIAEQRRREIVQRLRLEGYVEARRLAPELGVDISTIRRDLDALARSGLCQRTHGGALPLDATAAIDLPYDVKESASIAEKHAVAGHAAALVADGDTLVLDSGSTTYALACALGARRGLTIATNDLHIAHELAARGDVRLVVIGGELIETVFTLVGPYALAQLEGLHVDWAFLGADAIDPHAGVTNVNTLEVPLKRAMLAAAHRRVLITDSSKFGRRALASVARLEEFDAVITDDGLDAAARAAYGSNLVVVADREDPPGR